MSSKSALLFATVVGLGEASVNNSGFWRINGTSDNPDSSQNQFVLDPNGTVWREGQAVATPSLTGAPLRIFNRLDMNCAGDSAWKLTLSAPPTFYHEAVFFNNTFVLEVGSDASALTGAPVGSTWTRFLDVRANDLDQILVLGYTEETPGSPFSQFDIALTRVQLDASGAVVLGTPIVRDGDVLPDVTHPGSVYNIDDERTRFAFNNKGDAIFVTIFGASKAIHAWIGGNFSLLAEEGVPTVFDPNRTWGLYPEAVDLNDRGDTVFRAYTSDGSTASAVIVLNGSVFREAGDTFPAISPYTLDATYGTPFGSENSPVLLDSGGNVLWMGNWNHPDVSTSDGLFVNEQIVLQRGISTVNGIVIRSISTTRFGWSDNGRYVVFKARLIDGRDVLAMLDRAIDHPSFCFGDGGDGMGCTNCPCGNNAAPGAGGGCLNSSGGSAALAAWGSPVVGSDHLRFGVTGANPSSFGILQSADNQLPNMGACPPGSGLAPPILDGLRCVGGTALRHGTRATNANGDIGATSAGWGPPDGPPGGLIAFNGFVAGQTRNFQCFYREDPALGCLTGQNTTNAVSPRTPSA